MKNHVAAACLMLALLSITCGTDASAGHCHSVSGKTGSSSVPHFLMTSKGPAVYEETGVGLSQSIAISPSTP